MKRIIDILAVVILMTCSVAYAQGNEMNVGTVAGATALSNQTNNFSGGSQNLAIGLPGNQPPNFAGTYVPVSAPPCVDVRPTERAMMFFGPMVITDPESLKSINVDTDDYFVKLSPTPAFTYLNGTDAGETAVAINSPMSGNYSLLGAVCFSTKNGKVVMPPEDSAYITALIRTANKKLGTVHLVPVPEGFSLAIGMETDGSSFALSAVLSQMISRSLFGIAPAGSMQSGIVSPVGRSGRQFLLLKQDANGTPFSIKVPTQQEWLKMQADLALANKNAETSEKVLGVVMSDAEKTNARLQAIEKRLQRR